MLSLRRSEFPEAFWPKDRIRAERFGRARVRRRRRDAVRHVLRRLSRRGGRGPAVSRHAAVPGGRQSGLPGRGHRRVHRGDHPHGPAGTADAGLGRRKTAACGRRRSRRSSRHLRQQGGVAEPQPSHPERRWVQADAAGGRSTVRAATAPAATGPQGEGLAGPGLEQPGPVGQRRRTRTWSKRSAAAGAARRCRVSAGRRRPAVHPVAVASRMDEIEVASCAFLRTLGSGTDTSG